MWVSILLLLSTLCVAYAAPSYASYSAAAAPAAKSYKTPGVANPYSYSYTAPVGQYSDGMIAAQESGDGKGSVKGSYALMDPDGRYRMVYYVADAMGYRATIKTNEPGTSNEDPANVDITSSYVAPTGAPAASGSAYGASSGGGTGYGASSGYGAAATTAKPPCDEPAALDPRKRSTKKYAKRADAMAQFKVRSAELLDVDSH